MKICESVVVSVLDFATHIDPFRYESTPTIQDRMKDMRKAPGDFTSTIACIEVALVSAQEHIMAAMRVRDYILQIDPDMSESFILR